MEHGRSLKSMHSCPDGVEIREGFAQVFFPRLHQVGYFGVTVRPRQHDVQSMDLVQVLKDTFPDHNPANLLITLPDNPHDTNHFLEIQRWVPALSGLTGTEIRFSVREVNPALRELVSGLIGRYMDKIDEELAAMAPMTHAVGVAIGSYNK